MKNTKRILSLLLTVLMIIGSASMIFAYAEGEAETTELTESANSFEFVDQFNYESWEPSENSILTAEYKGDNQSSWDFAAPDIRDGVICMEEGESVRLYWKNIPGINTAGGTYTITFDATIKDTGDNSNFNNRKNWNRELYVSLGGWFDQVGLGYNGGNGDLRTAAYYDNDQEYGIGTTYSVKLVWDSVNESVTSSISRDGVELISGTRTGNGTYGVDHKFGSNWVFRCEDGAVEISNFKFTDGTVSFGNNSGDLKLQMKDVGFWQIETESYEGFTAPSFENGKMKMDDDDSIYFDWTALVPAEDYVATNTYSFEFDLKITDEGDGSVVVNATNSYLSRVLYVAPGGYWNQLGIKTTDGKIQAGGSHVAYDSAKMFNKYLHVRFDWKGETITTTLSDSLGNVIHSGSRTSSDFADINADVGRHTDLMRKWVIRCEDGAVEIDNFTFTVKDEPIIERTEIEIPDGKQAIYECDINFQGKTARVLHGSVELFSISNQGLYLCGCQTAGNYGNGVYHVKVYINPTQLMSLVEITLPSGGTIRRGSYVVLSDADELNISSEDSTCADNVTVVYSDITVNEYTVNTVEPTYEGFGANVYNLVTSFSDARYDRAFAWTALDTFIGDSDMAIRYRKQGGEWTVVSAVREALSDTSTVETFFKADIEGLTENTTYEYMIGKKDSENYANDWSKTYTFKTAAESTDSFSFIVIGDTQGKTWNGTTSATKGFMFAQTAINEAMEAVEDPAFIVHTGDVVENGGDVADEQWNMYFKALGEHATSIPHFATIGNHDMAAPQWFDVHLNHPNNGGSAAIDTTILEQGNVPDKVKDNIDETIYSFNYGDVHFIVLNSGLYNYTYDEYVLEAQRQWLINDLEANSDAEWTILINHQTVYHRTGGTLSRPWLHDVIEEYGVDLVLQGHSHLVTRTYPMKNGQIVTKNSPDLIPKGTGTVYTTVGATAYNHDSLGDPNVEEMLTIVTPHSEQPPYTIIDIDGDKISVKIRQADGLVLDEFVIKDLHEHDIVNHDAKAPTCTEIGWDAYVTCSKCNYSTYVEKGALDHSFTNYVSDGNATCTADGTKTAKCDRCDKTDTVADTGSKLGHSYTADVTAPTCTEGGYTTYTCDCGDTYTGDAVEANGHSFGDWAQTDAPTCTEKGEDRRDCANCDHYETREVAATGHSYTTVVTAPTCTEKGYTTYTCDCGDTYTGDAVEANGHSFGDWAQTDAPTCTEKGEDRRDCVNCDHYETREVAATGHSYTAVVTEPTCTEGGYTTYTCACGDTYTEAVEATGHKVVTVFEREATCTEAGKTEGKYCEVCYEVLVKSTVIPAGHVDENADEICDRCETSLKVEEEDTATSIVETIRNNVGSVIEKATETASEVAKNVANRARETAALISDAAEEAVKNVSETFESIQANVTEFFDGLKAKLEEVFSR